MHTANDVTTAQFRATIDGRPAAPQDVLPGWTHHDRLGLVLTRPYEALEASLLLQLAAALFYQARPERSSSSPQYPQLYLFHVEGPHGDFSGFDVWPPRHEVIVPAGDPYRLLGEINDRAITRLVIPDAIPADTAYLDAPPSGWTDGHAARERLRSILVYALRGGTGSADVTLASHSTDHPFYSRTTLDVEGAKEYFDSLTDKQLLDFGLGPSTAQDIRQWAALFWDRRGEVAESRRRDILAQLPDGPYEQTFHRTDADTFLRLLPSYDACDHSLAPTTRE